MKVTVDLTAPESHPTSKLPKALREFWYFKDGEELRRLIDYTGCPNTGCQHALRVWGERADVTAWLDLFQETYPETEPEIMLIKSKIRLAFVHGTGLNKLGGLTVDLKTITRQVGYNGEILTRPYFWAPFWEER
ncbi:hypothetical protein N1M2_172 [Klebsiella phage N1M2]|uniref:Uncharacterized protein n=1 Tax=Klebsiella phage N1M2 TaxID=2664939 RepID=A0A6B7ZF48_9CAUD|nr:hypothetical protein PQB72_gp172 [Klebsiella phage N1M2]QGH72035.1 hypothetical protein N1M2_172 [Klebsiella phage N1M2]